MRSKGSRWSIGNPLNRATAASSKASGAMRCFSRCSGTNCARLRQRQFAEVVFEGDFPERNGTQENLVLRVAHCGGESRGQLGIAGHEPEEFAGIQQNPHLPSNVCNTSRSEERRV